MQNLKLVIVFTLFIVTSCSEQKLASYVEAEKETKLVDGLSDSERGELRSFFYEMVKLANNYDASYVDCYSDDAVIKHRRIYPNGKHRDMEIPLERYKSIIRSVMPLAKEKGDKSTYSNIKYSKDGDRYKVEAIRYSHLKKYESPSIMILEKQSDGRFEVVEEYTESKPFGGH